MAMAKITLIGMNNYTDGSIWEGFHLPEGLDAEVAKNEIMLQCGEFQLLYPDATFLTAQIKHFCDKWNHNFARWLAAEQMEYEALFNLDVTATFTDDSRKKNDGHNKATGNSTTNVSAFDSSSFEPSNELVSEGINYIDETETYFNRHTEVRRGNQGSSFSQDMLAKEYDIRKWNIYGNIADVFATEFCVCIYE